MGIEPATFGATIRRHLFPEITRRCRIALDKPILLLTVARGCCVLRAQWCQQWCQMSADPCACNTVGSAEDLQRSVLVGPQRQTASSSRSS
jgi:hypothetical protein